MESYCIKDKRITPCVEPIGYQTDKNGRTQFYCHCLVCGIKKVRYVKSSLSGKKKNMKGDGSQALDQLSTKIRPNRKYKTDRKDLDGGALDIHKAIGMLPKPKSGWTLPGHRYTGSYNDLDSQVKYDPLIGEILEIYDKPTGKTDAIAMQHDVDYSVCKDDKKCKNKADRKMVKSLDSIPYNERQWGHWLARNMINTKQKLGLGVKGQKKKNVKSRRVKTIGKKN